MIDPNKMELHDITRELTFDTTGGVSLSRRAVRDMLRDWRSVSSMHPLATDAIGELARKWIARLTWRVRMIDEY